MGLDALDLVAEADSPSSQSLLPAWAALHRDGSLLYTEGLANFGLPELVSEQNPWSATQTPRRIMAAAALAAVGGGVDLTAGEVFTLGDHRIFLTPGPRGPARGRTFGRQGAVAIPPLDAGPGSATLTKSGIVRRV